MRIFPLLIALAACGGSAPRAGVATPTTDVTARRTALATLLKEQWEQTLKDSPELASTLGDRSGNDRWTDWSPAAIAARLDTDRAFLVRFEAIDTRGFPTVEALNQRLMVHALRQNIDGARFEAWLMPVDQLGFHVSLAELVSMLPFATVKDHEDYVVRLRAVPALVDQQIALMRAGLAKKLMPPRHVLEQAAEQARKMAAALPDKSPFGAPVMSFVATVPDGERARLKAAALAAVSADVLPAYARLAAFLRDEYAPHGRLDPGIWALPDGQARYAYAVKVMTTTRMTPDEIHELGLREVARIEAEQEAIARKLGWNDHRAFRAELLKNKKLFATSPQQIVNLYQKYTDRMYAKLPALFGRLPRQKMIILPVQPFREKEAAGAEYDIGTPDGSRPGVVRVNTSTPEQRLTIEIESTAYHEGVPGHHFQIALQQELPELPPFRQQSNYGAFVEGWALYAESLGKDVGHYEEPCSDYGRLQDEMLRAIRLVVDTGIHHKRWSRDQVVAFFHAHSAIDEPNVQSETDRYIVWPGQALGYKIGELTIRRLRGHARDRLGERFDIRAFHDEVLGAGSLPLDLLEERIEAWLAASSPAAPAGTAAHR